MKAKSTPIKRHVKIRSEANPYDPQWETYFEKRLDVKMGHNLKGKRSLLHLWKQQGGLCPLCTRKITVLFAPARLPNSQGGTATTLSGEVTVAKIRQTIASSSTQNVMSGFIAKG